MIKNKEKYIKNKEVLFMLNKLEDAHKNKDFFSASVLLTRLGNIGLKVIADDVKIHTQNTTGYIEQDIPF